MKPYHKCKNQHFWNFQLTNSNHEFDRWKEIGSNILVWIHSNYQDYISRRKLSQSSHGKVFVINFSVIRYENLSNFVLLNFPCQVFTSHDSRANNIEETIPRMDHIYRKIGFHSLWKNISVLCYYISAYF